MTNSIKDLLKEECKPYWIHEKSIGRSMNGRHKLYSAADVLPENPGWFEVIEASYAHRLKDALEKCVKENDELKFGLHNAMIYANYCDEFDDTSKNGRFLDYAREIHSKYAPTGYLVHKSSLESENVSLQESLKLAVETIEKALTYKNGICTTPTQDLEDNLDEIKEKHGDLK